MLLADIVNEVKSNFSHPLPGGNLIKSRIDSVIDRINVELGARRALIAITSGKDIVNWEDQTGDWEDTTNDWDEAELYSGFSYNSTSYVMTISDAIVKVEKIWVDNEEWQHRTYAEVTDSDNSDEYYYYFAGRQLHFPCDIMNNIVKMQVRLNYVYHTDTAVSLPDNYKLLLISGATYMLSAMPNYKDDAIFAVYKEIFEKHMFDIKIQKNMLETNQDRVRNYDYQGIQYGR